VTSDPAIERRSEPRDGTVQERTRDPRPGPARAVRLDRPDAVHVLVFTVGDRHCALAVEDVIEVVRMVAVTPLPEAPAWVAGVINMRGRIVPVIDLRTRLGMPSREPDLSTPIILVGRDEAAAGLIADQAGDVLALPNAAVEPPRSDRAQAPAVSGVAREGDRLILLLDVERLCGDSVHRHHPDGDALVATP
jgi:purine-binding chemotaxis protein CheW